MDKLAGLRLLLTRDQQRSRTLVNSLQQMGAKVWCVPTIDCQPVFVSKETIVEALKKTAVVVFTSVNAVNSWQQYGILLPESITVAAIGAATKARLLAIGIPVTHVPKNRFNSSELLKELLSLNLVNQKVVIISGIGGLTELQAGLKRAGAEVTKIALYQRCLPKVDMTTVDKAIAEREIDIIVATSGEALQNLTRLLSSDTITYLRNTGLLVLSERIKRIAEELGWVATITVAENAEEHAIMEAVLQR